MAMKSSVHGHEKSERLVWRTYEMRYCDALSGIFVAWKCLVYIHRMNKENLKFGNERSLPLCYACKME